MKINTDTKEGQLLVVAVKELSKLTGIKGEVPENTMIEHLSSLAKEKFEPVNSNQLRLPI